MEASYLYLIERLLDELLTVHDNYAIVVLINLNTEEVIYSILH